MKKSFMVLLAAAMMMFSCTAFASTDISSGAVEAEGYAEAANSPVAGFRAAKIDAYRNLLEQIESVQIDSETTVNNAMLASDEINASVHGFVKGAKVTKQFRDESGIYHVIISVPVYGGNDSLASKVLPRNTVKESFPKDTYSAPADPLFAGPIEHRKVSSGNTGDTQFPTGTPALATHSNTVKATGQYTGVIIDCRGLNIDTAMAPTVFTPDGKTISRFSNFSVSEIIHTGYVGYSKSMTSGVSRAGSNPLIIKAQRVERFVNPVISFEDADKLLAENQAAGFLEKGNMVFVR